MPSDSDFVKRRNQGDDGIASGRFERLRGLRNPAWPTRFIDRHHDELRRRRASPFAGQQRFGPEFDVYDDRCATDPYRP